MVSEMFQQRVAALSVKLDDERARSEIMAQLLRETHEKSNAERKALRQENAKLKATIENATRLRTPAKDANHSASMADTHLILKLPVTPPLEVVDTYDGPDSLIPQPGSYNDRVLQPMNTPSNGTKLFILAQDKSLTDKIQIADPRRSRRTIKSLLLSNSSHASRRMHRNRCQQSDRRPSRTRKSSPSSFDQKVRHFGDGAYNC